MQILLIMLIVVLLAFTVLLLALAKQSPREKQTEDKEQEEYIRDYAETVRQTGGSMKKLEHWKVIAIYLIIYDMIAVNFSYFMALLVRFDFRYSSIPTDYFVAWRSFAPIYTIIILAVFGCMSWIGPRPVTTDRPLSEYDQKRKDRLKVKPGITGYTQAYYRNNISQEDKLALDAKYAQKVTFLGDLKIFFKTIETVVCRKNVYTN